MWSRGKREDRRNRKKMRMKARKKEADVYAPGLTAVNTTSECVRLQWWEAL